MVTSPGGPEPPAARPRRQARRPPASSRSRRSRRRARPAGPCVSASWPPGRRTNSSGGLCRYLAVRRTASAREQGKSGSRAMSTAMRRAACGLRFPIRTWSIHSLPRSMVNSMSARSAKYRSSWSAYRRSSAPTAGRRSSSVLSGCGLCVPATTSSPCARNITSPYGARSPVAGLRVNSTPVPESGPQLPKTIACTVTPVPRLSGMPSCARYARARSLFQDRNTASTAPRSCSHGSSGASVPTISRYISRKRRRQSAANTGSPATMPSPAAVASLSPRSRIVSIIPGIDTGAPERTLTSKGLAGSPNCRPSCSAIRWTCACRTVSSASGQPAVR